MSQYIVRVPYVVWASITVEAEDSDAAIEQAVEHTTLGGYVGNGGYNKLCGTSHPDVSVQACDEALDDERIKIEVERTDG